jgi:P pilus assembly chaperone PapD
VPILTASNACRWLGALAGLALLGAPAQSGITLSQAVVDIQPGQQTAQDIEVWNDSKEIAYVVAEPSEVIAAGRPDEHRVPVQDPSAGGLLVTPQRMILQPQERKLLRIAAVGTRLPADRIWRVVVKPVAGPVTAPATAIKVLVGYDVLVVLRPDVPRSEVKGARQGNVLTLTNGGNTNVELYDGKLCATATPTDCKPLPSRRLYPGGQWQQTLPGDGGVQYRAAEGTVSKVMTF